MLPDSSSVLNANFSYKQAIASTSTPVQVLQSGQFWASVRWSFDLALVATLQPQYSVDGGLNWLNAPYSTRRDAVSASPTTAATVSPNAAAQTWETPLPGNANAFRLNPTAFTTQGNVTIFQGAPYVPGIPVVATLYDVTSGTNAALDTGILDTSGWSSAQHFFTMSSGTPSFSIQEVDDAGATLAVLTAASPAAFMGGLGAGLTIGPAGGSAGLAVALANLPLPRRMRYQSAAIAAQTSRIRIVARR